MYYQDTYSFLFLFDGITKILQIFKKNTFNISFVQKKKRITK